MMSGEAIDGANAMQADIVRRWGDGRSEGTTHFADAHEELARLRNEARRQWEPARPRDRRA